MIKVLAHGKHNMICPECGCVFEYDVTDINDNLEDLGGPGDRIYISEESKIFYRRWIDCPDCGFGIQVGGTGDRY